MFAAGASQVGELARQGGPEEKGSPHPEPRAIPSLCLQPLSRASFGLHGAPRSLGWLPVPVSGPGSTVVCGSASAPLLLRLSVHPSSSPGRAVRLPPGPCPKAPSGGHMGSCHGPRTGLAPGPFLAGSCGRYQKEGPGEERRPSALGTWCFGNERWGERVRASRESKRSSKGKSKSRRVRTETGTYSVRVTRLHWQGPSWGSAQRGPGAQAP